MVNDLTVRLPDDFIHNKRDIVENWQEIEAEATRLGMMSPESRLEYMKNLLNLIGTWEKSHRWQFMLTMFYLIGLRPEELLRMQVRDIADRGEDVIIHIRTAKKGRDAFIQLSKETTPFLKEIILPYVSYIETINRGEDSGKARLFLYKKPHIFNYYLDKLTKIYYDKYKVSVILSPYVFRKFRDSNLKLLGGNGIDIMDWRGGKSIKTYERSYNMSNIVSKFKDDIK